MNIFFVNTDPQRAAEALCDKHVPKMILETAQMLNVAYAKFNVTCLRPRTIEGDLYKVTHKNHPCTLWLTKGNLTKCWAVMHGYYLCLEYRKRFKRTHALQPYFSNLRRVYDKVIRTAIRDMLFLNRDLVWSVPLVMPDEYKVRDNPVLSYRQYYHSKTFAKWERGRDPPFWWGDRNWQLLDF